MVNSEEKERLANYTARALLMPYDAILEYLIEKKWETVSTRKRVKIIKTLCSKYNVTAPVAIKRVKEVLVLYKNLDQKGDVLCQKEKKH